MENNFINTDFLSNKVLSRSVPGKTASKEPTSGPKSLSKLDDEKLKTACKDFEAILLNFMFQSMRKTLSGDSLFGDSLGKDFYESMYYQELSTKISRGEHTVGIGEKLYSELKEKSVAGPEKEIKNGNSGEGG